MLYLLLQQTLIKMADKNPLHIGNNIRLLRILKGFKQIDFAKELGISKTTLSKIENDKQAVKIPRLQKIAASLKIKITQLFSDPSDLLPPPPMIFNWLAGNKLILNYPYSINL
jgi:transcriptional regulator with XRE-family HTH domain